MWKLLRVVGKLNKDSAAWIHQAFPLGNFEKNPRILRKPDGWAKTFHPFFAKLIQHRYICEYPCTNTTASIALRGAVAWTAHCRLSPIDKKIQPNGGTAFMHEVIYSVLLATDTTKLLPLPSRNVPVYNVMFKFLLLGTTIVVVQLSAHPNHGFTQRVSSMFSTLKQNSFESDSSKCQI